MNKYEFNGRHEASLLLRTRRWEGQQVEVLLSRAIDCLQRLLSQHGKLILAQRMIAAAAPCRKNACRDHYLESQDNQGSVDLLFSAVTHLVVVVQQSDSY